MKIEDLSFVRETSERLVRMRDFLSQVERGQFDVKSHGYNVALPKAHTDAIQALIVSGLRQQIADARKMLTDRGVELPAEA